jgi:integrase/recombinase XerC
MQLGNAVRDYLSERRRMRTLAPASQTAMRYRLWAFVDAMGATTNVVDVTRKEAIEWLADLELSPRTVRAHASAVRGLFSWLAENGQPVTDPFFGVKLPTLDKHAPVTLPEADVAAAFDACIDRRQRLIVSLMVQEGLRAGEVVTLRLDHIDRRRQTMLVRGKGNKERTVPFTPQTGRNLDAYLAEVPPAAGRPVIRNQTDGVNGLTVGYLSRMMSDLLYRAGVKHSRGDMISAHAFRRTAASDVMEAADGDIQVVQEFLGHESIMTTQHYLRNVAPRRLREAMIGRNYDGRA